MIEELQTAGDLLGFALERYLAACSAIAKCYDPADPLNEASRAISNFIPRQAELITAYETKIKQAVVTINRIRNATHSIVPVHALSPDILAHIFRLVRDEQPGYFKEQNSLQIFPLRYPETLSHICWRWRQIAISSRMLWTQIDVRFSQPPTPNRSLARAEVFAARADPSSLYIHVIGRPSYDAPETDTDLNAFCASVAKRIRSLNMLCHSYKKPQLSALESCLSNCTPGTLDEIHLETGFSKLLTPPIYTNEQFLDVSDRCLEDGLLHVKVLRLAGVYFHWTSQAYRGLLELHLVPDPTRQSFSAAITQMQLIEVLSGSPELHVLHFSLKIIDRLPHKVVSLNDLEVLNLRGLSWEESKVVLQLLSPGAKLLQLSVNISTARELSNGELPSFMSRSNIEELYLKSEDPNGTQESLPLFELCELLRTPHLRKLSLDSFEFNSANPSQPFNRTSPHFAFSRLDTLRLARCVIAPDDLRGVAEVVMIQKLELVGCLDVQGFRPTKLEVNGLNISVV